MAESERDPIQLRLITGRGDKLTFPLVPSAKPFSVGTQGDWVVTAEGVGPVHLFLAFDGTVVYVTPASQGHTVLLGGVPLGTGWTVAAIPSELRFAGARVALEKVWPATAGEAPGTLSTVSDGGALFEAARRALQDLPELEPLKPVDSPTPLKSPVARPFDATLAGSPTPRSSMPEAPRELGLSSTMTMERDASPLARRVSVPPGGITMTAGTGLGEMAGALPSTLPARDSQAPSTSRPGEKRAAGAWREASIPKKISLVLMPFAIFATYYSVTHRPVATRAVHASAAAAVSSSHVPAHDALAATDTVAALAPPKALNSPPASSSSKGTSAALVAASRPGPRASDRTAERIALDAVAAGDFENAASAYRALAAAHPEEPSFKDAARILNEKVARGR